MRGRYRSPPLRLNGGQEEEEDYYSSSKYGHNKRRRRMKRLITQAIFTLLVMFVLLVGCALLLRGAEGGGGGGVRYARRSAVFKHGHGKADSSTITHEDVTSRMIKAGERKRTRGSPLRISSTPHDDVETMLVNGDLTLKKRKASIGGGYRVSHSKAQKDVDVMEAYTFQDSKGNLVDLDEAQIQQLFAKFKDSKFAKRTLGNKPATFVNSDQGGGDTHMLDGRERRAAMNKKNEDTHVTGGYKMRIDSMSNSRVAGARASVELPIQRTDTSLAWTAILEDTSVHVTHTKDGSLRSMASRDAYLRRTSALALELLAADDAVMVEWAQEKVDERSRRPHDDGVKMESVHLSEEEEEDASPASHGLSTGSGIGGQEVIHGEDTNEGENDALNRDSSHESAKQEQHQQESTGRVRSESENDILYETMKSEHADRVTHLSYITPEYFARKWQKYISMTPSFDDRIFRGRGIVICGGGLRYIGSLWLTIKMLREQGSVLPIEIFGFGGEQPTPLLRKLFEDQNASFVSMDEIIPGGSTLFKGYVLKIFAILFSSFAEVLSLDSDNMPLVNVDTFFLDQASGDAAQETVDRYQPDRDGALFWPDFWSASVDSDLLLTLGIDPVVNEWMGTHDSGQMLVQKRKGWDALMLATFMSLHADTMYPMLTRNGVGIGDKEVLPLCFMALQIPAFKVRRSILPVGFVSHEQGEGDDPTKSTRKRMIDCGEDGGVGSVASAACNDLAHLRGIVSSESRIQDNDMGYASTAQKMSREVQVTFHGTTMGQYSPDETQGIALMHKNCAKWLAHDAIDPEFVNTITWTHYKPFNITLSETKTVDSMSSARGTSTRFKFVDVDAIQPRPPRFSGPGAICEIDVYDSDPQPLWTSIPNIETVERRARLLLHEFALSDAFMQYERWRTLRFQDAMERSDGFTTDDDAFQSNKMDAAEQMNDRFMDALAVLQDLRARASMKAAGDTRTRARH